MKETLRMLEQTFESSCSLTPQFAAFAKTFRREIRREIEAHHKLKDFKFSRGHFGCSGFFELEDGRIFYFSLDDVRWGDKGRIMIRTAKSFTDYSGGRNNWIRLGEGCMADLPKEYATV